MSRRIDVSDAENMSDEDRQYLASRGRSPEQERAKQEEINRIESVVEHDADHMTAKLDYMQRTGQPVLGDPALGRLRKPRQF